MGPALGGSFEAADVLAIPWHNFIFRPQLSVQSVATDNVFYGNNGVTSPVVFRPIVLDTNTGTLKLGPATTNNVVLRSQESDLISYVSPGLNVEYGLSGVNKLNFSYQLDELFYLNHPAENSEQHRFTVGINYQSGAFSVKGKDSYGILSTPLGGGSYISLLSVVIDRRVWDDAYTFQVDVTEKSAIYTRVAHSALDYQYGLPIYDSDNLTGTVGWAYSPAALLAITLESYYGQSALGSNLAALEKGPHSELIGGSIGARGSFTPKIEGSARFGVETRSLPGLVNGPSVISPAVDLSLNYTMTPKTLGTLAFSRRTDISGYYSGQTLIANSVSLNLQQAVGSSGLWFVVGRAAGFLAEYSDVDLPVNVFATDAAGNIRFDSFGRSISKSVMANYGRSETTLSAGLQLLYQPRPWLQVSLAYDYTRYTPRFRDSRVDASHPSIDYADNRATFRIGIGF
jgi:hypothetical protein